MNTRNSTKKDSSTSKAAYGSTPKKVPSIKPKTLHGATDSITKTIDIQVNKVTKAVLNDALQKKLVDAILSTVASTVTEIISEHFQDMQQQFQALQQIVKDQSRQLNELQQYTRRNSLRVFGVPEQSEDQTENTDKILQNIFREKMGVNIADSEICRTHRIGKRRRSPHNAGKGATTVKPRPIIIKFTFYSARRRVFLAKRKLKGSRIVVREDLTAQNASLLRSTQERYGSPNVWTSDGRVYRIDPVTKRRQRITCIDATGNDSVDTSRRFSEVDG
jgi:hypothetical protein